jgi:RimJ/RimL family protein N-acetyltransferase
MYREDVMKLVPITLEHEKDEALFPAYVRETMANARGRYGTAISLPWVSYLAEENGRFIGNCCFLSAPIHGKVEIRFFTFPDNEQRGVATRMCSLLLGMAAKTQTDLTVFAQTLPEENASTTVLRRNGFLLTGAYQHPENGLTWMWEKKV